MSNEFKGLRYSSIAIPLVPVDHPQYVWRGSADTDVQRTWKNHGWKPTHPEQIYTTQIRATASAVRAVRQDIGVRGWGAGPQ